MSPFSRLVSQSKESAVDLNSKMGRATGGRFLLKDGKILSPLSLLIAEDPLAAPFRAAVPNFERIAIYPSGSELLFKGGKPSV